MSGIGGISSAAILAAINAGAQSADTSHKPSLWAVALFLICAVSVHQDPTYVTTTVTAEIEAIIHRLRVRLMDDVRHAELLAIEALGRSRIFAAITSDAAVLTQASNTLCYSMQSVVVVFFVAGYVAYLSFAAFVLSVVIVAVAGDDIPFPRQTPDRGAEPGGRAGAPAVRPRRRLSRRLQGGAAQRRRSTDLFTTTPSTCRASPPISRSTPRPKPSADRVGAELHVHPARRRRVRGAAVQRGAAPARPSPRSRPLCCIVVGAVFGLVQSIPILSNANAAADRLEKLDSDLHAATSPGTRPDPRRRGGSTASRCATSSSVTRTGFPRPPSKSARSTSPCDPASSSSSPAATDRGNRPSCGCSPDSIPRPPARLTLDGMRITAATRNQYRALISTMFTDYHLFQRLYGISDPDPAEVDRLLRQFRLIDKTDMSGGEFRTARSFRRPAQAPRAHRQPAGKAADPAAGRVDGRPGPGISPQVLRRTVAATDARRHHRRGDHP